MTDQHLFRGDPEHLDLFRRYVVDEHYVELWNEKTSAIGSIDLRGAVFPEINATGINLAGAQLLGCQFPRSCFAQADLRGAGLEMMDISESNFRDALLADCACLGIFATAVDFSGADLRRVDFAEGRMPQATLAEAQVHGAQFMWCRGVSSGMLATAHGDSTTAVPAGAQRPANWS